MTNYFRFDDPDYDRKHSGLAQFCLLLAIYPFLIDFSLFSFAEFGEGIRIFVLTVQNAIVSSSVFTAHSVSGASPLASSGLHLWLLVVLILLPIVIYLLAVLTCLIRLRFGWLIFGMLPVHIPVAIIVFQLYANVVLGIPTAEINSGVKLLMEQYDFALWYNISAKIAFLWFALRGRIWSKSFRNFLIFAVVMTPVALEMPFSFSLVAQVLLLVLCLIVAATFLRILVMAVLDNIYLFRNLGFVRSLTGLGRSLVLWLPMTLLAVPYFYIHHAIEDAIRIEIYGLPVNFPLAQKRLHLACEADDGIVWPDVEWTPPRDHIMAFAAQRMLFLKACFDQKIDGVEGEIRAARDTGLTAIVQGEFDAAFPKEIPFAAPDNSFPFAKLKDFAVDQGHNAFNTGWGAVRASMLARLTKRSNEFEASFRSFSNTGLSKLDALKRSVDDLLVAANRDLQLAIWWSFAYMRAAQMLGHILFAFICLKSFLYVFSRVVFHRETGTFLTLGKTQGNVEARPAEIVFHGEEYVIPADKASTWFVARRFQAQGKPPRFAWPQPTKAPIARFLHRATFMNRVDVAVGDTEVHYSAMRGAKFVEWTLAPEESVVFDFRNFVAMSDGVAVSTLISPRITSMLLGHFIFSVATGPGKLLLMSDGRSRVLHTDQAQASFPPERLLAMNKDTRFHVESEMGIVDIYVSTAYLKPVGSGTVVVDVDRQKGGESGLGRFVTHFLLPG